MTQAYETVIGLEVHAQMLSKTKLFCSCSNSFGKEPNTQICPTCVGLPGALPVPNQEALNMAAKVGFALGCTVQPESQFSRKNYFYPDLPKGYQISQYDKPLNEHGHLDIVVDGKTKRVGILRAHVEEDAAKNLHGVGSADHTLVDYNRSGTPLVEIVSHPDLRSSEEAEAYLKRLREVLIFIGVNDGNLEEGSFRCDANVSVRPVGQEKLGTRTELKNINSFRFVKKAIEYEVARQIALINSGGTVVQETRTWNDAQGKTISMRSKEEAQDYRYFPDPDLPLLVFSEAELSAIKSAMPRTPDAIRARWVAEWGLTEYDAHVLTGHPQIALYYEAVVEGLAKRLGKAPNAELGKQAANFIQSQVLGFVTTDGLEANFPVDADALAELLELVSKETISGKLAKDVFSDMMASKDSPGAIVKAKGLVQVTDVGAIEAQVREMLTQFPAEVEKYRAGKVQTFGFLVGQAMRVSQGKANPKVLNDVLKRVLDKG